MSALFRRPRVLVVLGILVVLAAVLTVALARSRTPGCSVAPPELNLPPQLRTLGEFDQPFDVNDSRTLADAAVRAATALHPDLAGASVSGEVRETAVAPAQHDAVVLPLSISSGSAGQSRVVGLAAFLLDCGGRAYFFDVDDLLRTDPTAQATSFPRVSAAEAGSQLGISGQPRLIWRDSPFAPLWQDPASGRSVKAAG